MASLPDLTVRPSIFGLWVLRSGEALVENMAVASGTSSLRTLVAVEDRSAFGQIT